MTQEKVLFFLGLEKKQKIDKSSMKFAFWFDFIATMVIVICGLLFDLLPIIPLNISWFSFLILIDVVFFIFLKLIYNPALIFLYDVIVFLTTTLKLMYGYIIFSKVELMEDGYSMITWVHIIVLVCAVLASVYFLIVFYKVYQNLKNNTEEYIVTKISQKNKTSKFKWIIIILGALSPMAMVRLLEDSMQNAGLGIGFALWSLACIWLFLTSLFIPKLIVAVKYNAFSWFKNKEID